MLEVVAGVDDDTKRVGAEHAIEPIDQPGAAHSSCERNDSAL